MSCCRLVRVNSEGGVSFPQIVNFMATAQYDTDHGTVHPPESSVCCDTLACGVARCDRRAHCRQTKSYWKVTEGVLHHGADHFRRDAIAAVRRAHPPAGIAPEFHTSPYVEHVHHAHGLTGGEERGAAPVCGPDFSQVGRCHEPLKDQAVRFAASVNIDPPAEVVP